LDFKVHFGYYSRIWEKLKYGGIRKGDPRGHPIMRAGIKPAPTGAKIFSKKIGRVVAALTGFMESRFSHSVFFLVFNMHYCGQEIAR
jgi:hypothetical protein